MIYSSLYFHLILQAKTHFKRKDFYIHGLLQTRLHRLPKHPFTAPSSPTVRLPSSAQKPKNSRQVGCALRTSKLGPNIPAHRILNASGILSGATSFRNLRPAKNPLESEGVTSIIRTDKGWKTDLKNISGKLPLTMLCILKVYLIKITYKQNK